MPSFDYTVELERALLKIMVSSPMMCRMHIHRLNENIFTSRERKFIFRTALEVFLASKNTLSKDVFSYEVGCKVEEKQITYYMVEWELIENYDAQDSPEILIAKLKEANVGRKVLSLNEELVGLLEKGDIEQAVAHLKRTAVTLASTGEGKPVVILNDYERRKQLILDKKANPEKYLGIKTGFKTFDDRTGGLFPGELTLIAGISGGGKSTFVRQIEKGIVTCNLGKNVLHIANEEYLEQVEHKFDASFTEIEYRDFKLATISDVDLERWEFEMQNWQYGLVCVKEVPAFTDITLVEQTYQELVNAGIPIHVIIIDHLPHIKAIQRTWSENDELKKAASDCKELARSLHLPLVVPTQAATIVVEKQEKGKRAGQVDVYGSKGQVHVSNTFLIITEKGKDNTQTDREEWERDVFWLCDVKKNRDGPKFWFRAKHYVRNGKVEEELDPGAKHASAIPDDQKMEVSKQIEAAAGELHGEAEKKEKAVKQSAMQKTGEGILVEQSEQVNIVAKPIKYMSRLEKMRALGIVRIPNIVQESNSSV